MSDYTIGIRAMTYRGKDAEVSASFSDQINLFVIDEDRETSVCVTLSPEDAAQLAHTLATILERLR